VSSVPVRASTLTAQVRACPVYLGKFRNVLHEAIQAGLRERVDNIQINGAIQLQQGWMHIHGTGTTEMTARPRNS
jgi:hypothetical protein